MDVDKGLNIIHGDLDAFYAAIEQRDNPTLRGKPVIVGGDPNSRGVVSTCSYEAREFGVRSAMPLSQAKRLCPEAIFLPVNMKLYRQVSRQIMAIMTNYTPIFEPLSIDEAFLDVSGCHTIFGSAQEIARQIKGRVHDEHGLIISMGISYNKFLAKLATELGKPDGLYVIEREKVMGLLPSLPVSFLWGAGSKTQGILKKMGIKTMGELCNTPREVLERQLGAGADIFLQLAQGIDHRQVEPDHQCKSMGKEITFEQDSNDKELLDNILLDFSGRLARRLRRQCLLARTVTVKIKYHDFHTITRSKTLAESADSELVFHQTAHEILKKIKLTDTKVRLIGLSLSNFCASDTWQQGLLFEQQVKLENIQLDQTLDNIRDRFGDEIITRASLLNRKKNA